MEKTIVALGSATLVIGLIFVVVILGAFCGYLSGWIVSLFFDDTILAVLAALGIKGVTVAQFGAFMGFVGGFVRSNITRSND